MTAPLRDPTATASPPKPLLRGVSHEVAFFVSAIAIALLARSVRAGVQSWCVLVFGASLLALFATSALYHRVNWSAVARQRMRRLDHSAIFILIAGGYTPLFALVPSKGETHVLTIVWTGAILGVVKSLAWPQAPKWLTALLAVMLGWVGVVQVIERVAIVGWPTIAPLIASGCVYSLGAVVYALKRPDPAPRVFGYHEVFHALVVIASALLFVHVVLVLKAT